MTNTRTPSATVKFYDMPDGTVETDFDMHDGYIGTNAQKKAAWNASNRCDVDELDKFMAHPPSVLFDGFAVLQALHEKAKWRTSAENVSDVLDAVVRLMRSNAEVRGCATAETTNGDK